jgi:hypothetical protein
VLKLDQEVHCPSEDFEKIKIHICKKKKFPFFPKKLWNNYTDKMEIQSNLSTTATLGTPINGRCTELAGL